MFFRGVVTPGMNYIFSRIRVSHTNSRPPHQIVIWVGLERYGYLEEAQRLAYRFLYMYVTMISYQRRLMNLPG